MDLIKHSGRIWGNLGLKQYKDWDIKDIKYQVQCFSENLMAKTSTLDLCASDVVCRKNPKKHFEDTPNRPGWASTPAPDSV